MLEENAWVYILSYLASLSLIMLGIFGMVVYHHLIRMIFGLLILEAGVNLFLLTTGFRPEADAPILTGATNASAMVDPIPQALVLTAIVIGVGVLALALALVVRVYQTQGTLDTRELARRLAREAGTGLVDDIPVREKDDFIVQQLPKLEDKS